MFLFGIIGLLVGQFIDWCNTRLPEYKKVFSKEFFTVYLKECKPKYILMFLMATIYIVLLYMFGNKEGILYKIQFLEYIFISPMLVSAFIIDIKHQIIPNRLNLTLFEVGLGLTFVQGILDINIAINIKIINIYISIFFGKFFVKTF